MKINFYILVLILTFYSCKSENKSSNVDPIKEPVEIETGVENFENLAFSNSLLDYRDINNQFTPELIMNGFGMKKINDSTYAFVFKLAQDATQSEIEKYSFGFKSFYAGSQSPINATFSPNIQSHDGDKFLIMKKKIKETKAFDSIDAYIYSRNNWKSSGRIGGFKIYDVLFDN